MRRWRLRRCEGGGVATAIDESVIGEARPPPIRYVHVLGLPSSIMKHNLREILHVHDSDVTDSHFANASLLRCRFQNVNFRQSKFTGVDFSEVSLADVNLTNASIAGANLTGMTIDGILVSDLLAAYQARVR